MNTSAIADPLTPEHRRMRAALMPTLDALREEVDALRTRVDRLEGEIRELRSTLAYERRMSMPKPIQDAHALELLDRAAQEAQGETGDEILADAWDRWMRALDGEVVL